MRHPGKLLALAAALTSLTALASGGSAGNVWFTESADLVRRIGRLDTKGKLTEFPTPSNPDQLVVGSDGNIWFTMPSQPSSIGRLTPAGVVTEFTPPNDGGYQSFPGDITSGPDGNLWFTMGSKT